MDDRHKKLLTDIANCINHIEEYLLNAKVFLEYENNLLLQDAVERNLITIGEAMGKLLILEPTIAITNARRIVDARNKLAHGYDEIENVQVWSILINHLPLLKKETIKLLND
jgi:uncharacterized protein with HEPN domain